MQLITNKHYLKGNRFFLCLLNARWDCVDKVGLGGSCDPNVISSTCIVARVLILGLGISDAGIWLCSSSILVDVMHAT